MGKDEQRMQKIMLKMTSLLLDSRRRRPSAIAGDSTGMREGPTKDEAGGNTPL